MIWFWAVEDLESSHHASVVSAVGVPEYTLQIIKNRDVGIDYQKTPGLTKKPLPYKATAKMG